MMKVTAVILSIGVSIVSFTLVQADDISGTYDVVGSEPSGIRYEGTATIAMTGGTTATSTLVVKSGTYLARCIVLESEVACYADAGGEQYTIGLYRRRENGALEGSWDHSGFKGIGTETLTRRQ